MEEEYRKWKDLAISLCQLASSKISENVHTRALQLHTSTAESATAGIQSSNSEISMKENNADLVTQTDQLVEHLIRSLIAQNFPSHQFVGEETLQGKLELTDCPTWVVDPIDGTMNFVHALPGYCISIGVLHNKQPVVGVIYEVFHDKMYYAVKGQGAFCNGKPLIASNCNDIKNCLIMTETTSRRDQQSIKDVCASISNLLLAGAAGIRMTGSAAQNLARVAEGTADVYFEYGPHVWDVAAGVVILTEAGGRLLNPRTLKNSNLIDRQFLAIGKNPGLATIISPLLVHNIHLEND